MNFYAMKSNGKWWKDGTSMPTVVSTWAEIQPVPALYHPDTGERILWEDFDRLLPAAQLEYGYVKIRGKIPATPEGQRVAKREVVDVRGVPTFRITFAGLPLPEPLPDAQFAQGLWQAGLISFDECQALVATGDVPEAVQGIVDLLDDDGDDLTPRKQALLLLKSTRSYPFDSELVDRIRQELGWTAAQMRAAWSAWATL